MNTGKILISDLKKDVEKIQAIASNDRMFAQFLRLNEHFVYNIVSKVTAATLNQLKKTDANLDYDTLQQVGRLSLHHAMLRFTNDKAATLSTFAFKAISNDVKRHVNKQLKLKFNEESLESFSRGENHDSSSEYDERHFQPLVPKYGQFEDEILDRIVFEEHFTKFTDEQQQVYKMLAEGKSTKEIRAELGMKRRALRKMCERELPIKIDAMKKAMAI